MGVTHCDKTAVFFHIMTKKSQKCYISPIWGSPVRPIRPKSCLVGDVYDIITCAKFQIEIFMG